LRNSARGVRRYTTSVATLATILTITLSAFGQGTSVNGSNGPGNTTTRLTDETSILPGTYESPGTELKARTLSKTKETDATVVTPQASGDANGWRFEIEPYLWAANLDGTLRVRDTTAQVEAKFADLIKNLDFALAARFEATKGPLTIIIDENYMNLGLNGTGPLGLVSVDVQPAVNIFEGGEKMNVWVSDDMNRIPVRIESPISVGNIKVDMMGYRNLKYPLSSLINVR